MSGKITYNEEHLKNIIKQYSECKKEVETLKSQLKLVEKNLNNCYLGMANMGLNDTFKVLYKHLDLYEECYETTESYVRYTLTTSIFIDNMLAKTMQLKEK